MTTNEISGTRHDDTPTTPTPDLTPDGPPRAVEGERTGSHGNETANARTPRPRGFAAMDRRLVTEIARKGGKAAHTAGTAHEFTTDEAREAGRKGGRATHAKRRKAAEDQAEGAAAEEKHEQG